MVVSFLCTTFAHEKINVMKSKRILEFVHAEEFKAWARSETHPYLAIYYIFEDFSLEGKERYNRERFEQIMDSIKTRTKEYYEKGDLEWKEKGTIDFFLNDLTEEEFDYACQRLDIIKEGKNQLAHEEIMKLFNEDYY